MTHSVLANGDILIQPSVRPPTNSRYRQRRIRLFQQQGGLCFWCKKPMVLLDLGPKAKVYPPNLCTVDHLRDRFHPERQVPANGAQRWVAACRTCNEQRGKERCTALINEQRRRSGHGHLAGPLPAAPNEAGK